jgi:hypothetical protein
VPAATQATAKPTASGAKGGSAAKGKSAADDENMIESDASLNAQAFPVSVEKAPNKTLEITCPFCKSVGYVSQKAAGMHVKCHNSKCLVPIFKAPEIKKEVAPPPPPPKKKSKLPMIAVAVVLVGAIAGGIWWVMQPPQEVVVNPNSLYVPKGPGEDDPDQIITDPVERQRIKDEAAKKNVVVALTPELILKTAAANLIEVAQATKLNTSKAECRRSASIAFAVLGDAKAARDQLERAKELGKNAPEYQIVPLVAIAWNHLASGNTAECGKSLDAAAALTGKLQAESRFTAEATVELATALVATGREDAARDLVLKHPFPNSLGQLTAVLHVSRHAKSFNPDATYPGQSLGDWQNPLWVAVTIATTSHGHWDQALKFAREIKDEEIRTECVAAWAEVFARQALLAKKVDDVTKARDAGAGLSVAGQARVLARVAAVQAETGAKSDAEATLKLATDKLGGIAVPPAVRLGELKDIRSIKLPEPVPLRLASAAAAEIAAVQDRLGQADAAWKSLQTSLAFARAMAPSPVAADQRVVENDGRAELVRLELKALLELKAEDDIRREFNRFKRQCTDLHQAAQARFQWQVRILRAAARWGIRDRLWDEFQILSAKTDPNDQEPYVTTTLPQWLVFQITQSGKATAAQEIVERFAQLKVPADPFLDMERTTSESMTAGDVEGTVAQLGEFRTDSYRSDLWAVRLASRQVQDGRLDVALRLSMSLGTNLFRDDATRCTAALGAVNGHAETLWKFAQERPASSERSALQLGLIEGLSARLRTSSKNLTAK